MKKRVEWSRVEGAGHLSIIIGLAPITTPILPDNCRYSANDSAATILQ